MMRNRPWKLFSGNSPATALRPVSNKASSVVGHPTANSDPPARSSAFAEPLRRVGLEFAGCDEPVMVLDLDGRLLMANEPASMLGRRLGVPLDHGMPIELLLTKLRLSNGGGSPEWAGVAADPEALAAAAEPLAGGEIFELRSVLRDGRDGQPADWVVRLLDVTPLVIALRDGRAAVGHRDRLLKLLSHDMRTPLAAILATLKHPDLGAAPLHLREIIESSAHRALSMVDSNVRLIRAQCSDYRFVELDFSHVVEEAIDACWSLAKEARVRIVLQPTRFPLPISADRGYLTEGLNELFANLIDRGAPSGVLSCALSLHDWAGKPAVTLHVYEAAAVHAAERSSRAPTASPEATLKARGSFDEGGGLDLFKTVVTRHGGMVSCENEEDLGMGISVTLPSLDAALQPS